MICASVNDEVVHGIPGERVIESADIVSIDCGAIIEGWHGDAAISIVMPDAGGRHSHVVRGDSIVAVGWAGAGTGRVITCRTSGTPSRNASGVPEGTESWRST